MTTAAIDGTAALRERILDASARTSALRIVGRGTWLDAGRPVAATETISVRDLSGITQYVPADLTLTARAGTTLGEVRDATAANGQWLALDPFGSSDGTLGATVATASAGPLRTSFGSPRDLLLGLEFVTGAGTIARGGGRVVKNVAGFDLSRLLTGSWGTLGVVTEVTLRLHARPEADATVAVAIDDGAKGVARTRELLRKLPFTPYACEILNAPLAVAVLGMTSVTALFRLGGNSESVRAQRASVAELGAVQDVDEGAWDALRTIEPASAIVFRLSRLPAEVERTWNEADAIASGCAGTMLHASPARGVVRCIIPTSAAAESHLAGVFAAPHASTRIGERLPAALWPVCSPSPISDHLSSGVKGAFDEVRILNPGIFGEPA